MNKDEKSTKKEYEIPHGLGDEVGILQARALSGDMKAFKLLLNKAIGIAKEAGMLDLYKQYEETWKNFLKIEAQIDFFKDKNGELNWCYSTMHLPNEETELYKEVVSILGFTPKTNVLLREDYKLVVNELLRRKDEVMPTLHIFITNVFKGYPSYKDGLWNYVARLSEAEKGQIRTDEEERT